MVDLLEAKRVEEELLRVANGPDVYCRNPSLMRAAARVIRELRTAGPVALGFHEMGS